MYQNGACYIRVSTDDQTEYSPTAQLKLLKKYAKDNDIILTKEHIFIDEGVSGKRADKRPEFMRMIATAKIKPKPFDVILVHKFDRFARSREDSIVYKSLLRKECDIKVISTTESIEDDKFSVILEAMLEAMAEYYSLNLADEVKKGMTEKAERGEYQTTAPFGYKMVNKELVPLAEEAKLIQFAFEKYADNEINLRQLATYFNKLGVRTHRGNAFDSRHFEYFFHNPVYIGKARWTPTHKRKRHDYNNPDVIIKDSTHQPLIDIETWDRVQKRMNENKEIWRYKERTTTAHRTWLSGLVKCANCGKTLIVQGQNYLQCNGYVKSQCEVSCHIKYSLLEEAILEILKETYESKIEVIIVPKETNYSTKSEQEVLTQLYEKLESREERIKMAFQDGIDTIDEYKENKKRIETERQTLIEKLEELKKELHDSVDEEIYKRIESVCEVLTDDYIDMETKYKTAHFLIEKVIYSKLDKVLKITYK